MSGLILLLSHVLIATLLVALGLEPHRYREMFYDASGNKIVPVNIAELMTPIVLAYWFMAAGFTIVGTTVALIRVEHFSYSEC